MTRTEFIALLRQELKGLSVAEIDGIAADYAAHFDEASAANRSEDEVAHALGDPARLAREWRAESKLRQWESQRTPATLMAAMAALSGMIVLDIFVLLPFLLVAGFVVFVLLIVLFSVGAAGLAITAEGLLHWRDLHLISATMARDLAGIGLVAGSVGVTAVLWLLLEKLVGLLGRYARLHYRVLKPL